MIALTEEEYENILIEKWPFPDRLKANVVPGWRQSIYDFITILGEELNFNAVIAIIGNRSTGFSILSKDEIVRPVREKIKSFSQTVKRVCVECGVSGCWQHTNSPNRFKRAQGSLDEVDLKAAIDNFKAAMIKIKPLKEDADWAAGLNFFDEEGPL